MRIPDLKACLFAAVVMTSTLHNPVVAASLDIDEKLQQELLQVFAERGDGYKPRTEHFKEDGTPQYINRLIKEDSPYLLQHAHNPVNWYPWSDEAFEKAKALDKPVFLSIGYATCHWCHVMERESFESEEIATQMNEQFIAIKVDREQLPDVDAMYMLGVQVTTGSGGWPLSGFLMPDGKLFHGATYMPADIFSQVMNQVTEVWSAERPRLLDYAENLAAAIAESGNLTGEAIEVGQTEITQARESLLLGYDSFQGGFGPAPKFPRESSLFFLLDLAERDGDEGALEAADFSLVRMSAGGIHDQVGGGFHRYTVDDDWLIPHFEKMLYTQASLLQNYTKAFELTGRQEHARTARRIADYVLRDMTTVDGGFYSATDADSASDEGSPAEEGVYFIWEQDEIRQILADSLGSEEADLALELWGVSAHGNFEEKNILRLEDSLANLSDLYDIPESELAAKLNNYAEVVLQERKKRIPPLTDRKIITEWNAMMSTALLKAGRVLNEPRYTQAGMNAIEFLLQNNKQSDGSLWRARFEGRSTTSASQPDYAYLAHALITAFDESGESKWLDEAIRIVEKMNDEFWDSENSGYFIGQVSASGAKLPTRPKAIYDNAAPTGNSLALKVLVQLWNRTGEDKYRERAERLVTAFSSLLVRSGSGLGFFLTGTNDLINGEIGPHRYVAKGKVKASVAALDDKSVSVVIDVADGWHVNSDQPLQDYLIPTKLSLNDGKPMTQVDYPQAVTRKLGFQRSELSLLEGKVQLTGVLPETAVGSATTEIELQLQACSDEICLAPETLSFKVPLTQLSTN